MAYVPSGKEEQQFLHDYDASKYQNPAVAADIALFAVDGDDIKILLIKRGGFPYKDCWALPGGFVEMGEDVLTSAKRELNEETGIEEVYMEQSFTWGKINRDPRSRVITVSHIALTHLLNAKAGDDASEAEWFSIKDYTKTDDGKNTKVQYTLSGPVKLSAQVVFPVDAIQEIECEKNGGLAFDHAESIGYSIELLKARAKYIAAISLDKTLAAHAIEVISKRFG